jgi:hypothetical protein
MSLITFVVMGAEIMTEECWSYETGRMGWSPGDKQFYGISGLQKLQKKDTKAMT